MKTSQVLKKALKLIDRPSKWTKKEMASTKQGYPCSVGSSLAAKHCAIGAVCAVTRISTYSYANLFLQNAIYSLTGDSIVTVVDFNDSPNTKHEHVKIVFKQAIQDAERVGE